MPKMKSILEYLSIKVKPSIIKANDNNIRKIVKDEIKRFGNEADLNHIDVSEVTNFTSLFFRLNFEGDVSRWDVHNMKIAEFMFSASLFNGDLSKWDVSNCENFNSMFNMALLFEGKGLENWNIKNAKNMSYMFHRKGNFTGKTIMNWELPSSLEKTDSMFKNCFDLETDFSKWDINNVKLINKSEMFDYCYKMKKEWLPKGLDWYHFINVKQYDKTKANKDIGEFRKNEEI